MMWLKYIYLFFPLLIFVFFFGCTDLHFSPWNCSAGGLQDCDRQGDTTLLFKEAIDIIVVLDNSPKGQEFNPQVLSNLDEFLQCMDTVDWKIGVVSSAKQVSERLGSLNETEINGELLGNKFISPNLENHEKIFSDTISLKSGCDYPPYCSKNKPQPLGALKNFMENEAASESGVFLRDNTPLSAILISSAADKKKWFNRKAVNAEEALNSIRANYQGDNFTAFSVVDDLETGENCIAAEGFFTKSVNWFGKVGKAYATVTMEPVAVFASLWISPVKRRSKDNVQELIQFANQSGGKAIDICSPLFGRALAYSILEQLKVEDRFPEKCKKFKSREEREEEEEEETVFI